MPGECGPRLVARHIRPGKTLRARVMHVVREGPFVAVALEPEGRPREAFLSVHEAGHFDPRIAPGLVATFVFVAGGPLRGRWELASGQGRSN